MVTRQNLDRQNLDRQNMNRQNVFFQQAEIVIQSDCVHGGRNSIRMWLYNNLSLRVIFTYHYIPPKPHFSTRIPIACQVYELGMLNSVFSIIEARLVKTEY